MSASEVTFTRDIDVFTDSVPATHDRHVDASTGIAAESDTSTANRRDEITAVVSATDGTDVTLNDGNVSFTVDAAQNTVVITAIADIGALDPAAGFDRPSRSCGRHEGNVRRRHRGRRCG